MGGSDGEGDGGGGRKRSRSPEKEGGEGKGKGKERRDDSGSESDASGSSSGSDSDSSSSSSSSGSSGSSSGGGDRKRHKRERNLEEAMERAKHRDEVAKRSKMWQTVGSSDSEGGSGSDSGSEAEGGAGKGKGKGEEEGGERRGEKKRKKEKKAKKDRKKDKKKKKEKKHKKEKKRKKESKKHHKKKDKKRKRSSKDKDVPASMMGAVDLNKFGSRGILREGDFHRKKRDFEVWLQEVVGLPEIPRNRHEALRHFRQYCEDYNTATFPHEKYYDVEKFEMDEYQKQQQKAAFAQMRAEGVFNDEEERRRERKKSQAQQEKEDFEWAMKMMNKDKIEALKEEDMLRAKMKQAYKSGDLATVESIQYKLMTEEERERAKRKAAFTG